MHKTIFTLLKIYTKGRNGEGGDILLFIVYLSVKLTYWVSQKVRLGFSPNEPSDQPNIRCWRKDTSVQLSSVTQSCPTLQPHKLQHARPPCQSPTPRVYSNSRPLSRWCHPAISSSVVSFSFCPQSLPTSGKNWKNHSLDQTDLCWQSNVSAF